MQRPTPLAAAAATDPGLLLKGAHLPRHSKPLKRERQCVLVSLDWIRAKDPSQTLGAASIRAAVEEIAPTRSLYFNVSSGAVTSAQVTEAILTAEGDLRSDCSRAVDVALGSFVWNERYVREITEGLKQKGFKGKVMLGGPQVSYADAGMLEAAYPYADVFIRGYGEAPIGLLMSGEEPLGVPGVHVSGGSDRGTKAEVDLDVLPSPFLSGRISPNKFMRWETKRGCPQRCSFCQHKESDYTFLRSRNLSFDRVQKEAHWFASNGITNDLAILDPTFNTGPSYINVLRELRNSKFQGKLSMQLKGDLVKQEFLQEWEALSSSGIEAVGEFGLQTIHVEEQKAIRRRDNLPNFKRIMSHLGERGIPFEISIIFGLPLQTLESFKQTVEFCLSMASEGKGIVRAFPLMLLRGTELQRRQREWGLIESSEGRITGYLDDMPYVIQSNSFTYEEWTEMRDLSKMLEYTEGAHPPSL